MVRDGKAYLFWGERVLGMWGGVGLSGSKWGVDRDGGGKDAATLGNVRRINDYLVPYNTVWCAQFVQ